MGPEHVQKFHCIYNSSIRENGALGEREKGAQGKREKGAQGKRGRERALRGGVHGGDMNDMPFPPRLTLN